MSQNAYRVELEHYYGPLDLLLYLVQEHELDIFQIPISRVADQYIGYLEALKERDVNVSGDFLVMASYLMVLKSRALVPSDGPLSEEEEEDARPLAELVKKLLEFREVKDRAMELAARRDQWARRAPRGVAAQEGTQAGADLEEVQVWDLLVAYARLVERTSLRVPMRILFRDVPIEEFIAAILAGLVAAATVTFSQVVGDPRDRGRVIGTFLAVLELMKQQRVRVQQPEERGEIVLSRGEAAGPPADGRAGGI